MAKQVIVSDYTHEELMKMKYAQKAKSVGDIVDSLVEKELSRKK